MRAYGVTKQDDKFYDELASTKDGIRPGNNKTLGRRLAKKHARNEGHRETTALVRDLDASE